MGKQVTVRIWGLPLALTITCGLICALAASARAEVPSQDSCVAAALARPDNVASKMIRPGNKWQQEILAVADFAPTPAGCLSLITRQTPNAFFKMQRPKNHKQWTRTKGQELGDPTSGFPFQPIGDEGGTGQANYDPPKPIKRFRYRCTPGKGITHVRVVIAIRVDSVVDGSLLARKSYSWPVEIEHGLTFTFGGGVKKAC